MENELVGEIREQVVESDEVLQRKIRRLVNKFRDTRDVTTFSKLSYDESYVVSKYYLIHELIKIGKPAIPAVTELMEDKNHLLRELAVKTLAEIGDQTTVPAIIRALQDEKRRVRSAALAALKKLTRMSFGSYAKRNQSHENQEQVIRKWQSWWTENEKPFMASIEDNEEPLMEE